MAGLHLKIQKYFSLVHCLGGFSISNTSDFPNMQGMVIYSHMKQKIVRSAKNIVFLFIWWKNTFPAIFQSFHEARQIEPTAPGGDCLSHFWRPLVWQLKGRTRIQQHTLAARVYQEKKGKKDDPEERDRGTPLVLGTLIGIELLSSSAGYIRNVTFYTIPVLSISIFIMYNITRKHFPSLMSAVHAYVRYL